MTPYIPVYDNGVLLWGEEPGGGTAPTPTAKPTSTPTPTPNGVLLGDLNDDGKINSIDFALLRCELLGIPHAGINKAAADLNGDGKINSIDFANLRKHLLGIR